MDMMSVKEASEKWGVSPRFIQMLCKDGQIPGASRFGRSWMIPVDAVRPAEAKRKQAAAAQDEDQPLPRKTPFLYMTNLYHTPGCAAESIESISDHHEAKILLEAEIAYSRGDIDAVYERASYLLAKHSGFYAVLSAGMLLGLCAMWRGDMEMWKRAKMHICEAPCKNDTDRDILSLSLTALDSVVYDTRSFPEWFKMGNFEPLHPDALPAAKVFYAKYLYAAGYAAASHQTELHGFKGLSLMAMLPHCIEPMISQAIVDKTVVVEIHLRLICAVMYHNAERDDQAIRHLDRAIALALPDGLYGLLAEYRRSLDALLDSRMELYDRVALAAMLECYKRYNVGWAKLSGTIRNRHIETTLTVREREVAKLAAFGMSNAEIAAKLHVSLAAVKQSVRIAIFKGGVNTRDELALIL